MALEASKPMEAAREKTASLVCWAESLATFLWLVWHPVVDIGNILSVLGHGVVMLLLIGMCWNFVSSWSDAAPRIA